MHSQIFHFVIANISNLIKNRSSFLQIPSIWIGHSWPHFEIVNIRYVYKNFRFIVQTAEKSNSFYDKVDELYIRREQSVPSFIEISLKGMNSSMIARLHWLFSTNTRLFESECRKNFMEKGIKTINFHRMRHRFQNLKDPKRVYQTPFSWDPGGEIFLSRFILLFTRCLSRSVSNFSDCEYEMAM